MSGKTLLTVAVAAFLFGAAIETIGGSGTTTVINEVTERGRDNITHTSNFGKNKPAQKGKSVREKRAVPKKAVVYEYDEVVQEELYHDEECYEGMIYASDDCKDRLEGAFYTRD